MDEILHIAGGHLSGVGAAVEGNGMEALAGPGHNTEDQKQASVLWLIKHR